jgi:Rieske Fe-S protein
MADPQEKASRRGFLSRGVKIALAVVATPAVFGIVKYLIPPRLEEKIVQLIQAGKVADIPPDSAKIMRFNKTPIVLVHTAEGQMKAFSAVCTHLGCIVEYRPDEHGMHCNCHGSRFDLNGKNVGGPAPRPLIPFRVEVKAGEITVYKS